MTKYFILMILLLLLLFSSSSFSSSSSSPPLLKEQELKIFSYHCPERFSCLRVSILFIILSYVPGKIVLFSTQLSDKEHFLPLQGPSLFQPHFLLSLPARSLNYTLINTL